MSDTLAEWVALPVATGSIRREHRKDAPEEPVAGSRVVITGKGGVGKTTITALLAHLLAREGYGVLAVDGDPQQNLAVTLGIPPREAERIPPVSGNAEYLREKVGAGAGISPGGWLTLNPDVTDVVDRFAVGVTGNLRVLVMGGVRQAGSGCLCPEYTLLSAVLRNMPLISGEVVLLDTPAGLEHFGRAVADGFTSAVVVADPSYNAFEVAKKSGVLARQLGIGHRILVVNRLSGREDRDKVRERANRSGEFSRVMLLASDPDVRAAEPVVIPLLQSRSEFMQGMRSLADAVTGEDKTQQPVLL